MLVNLLPGMAVGTTQPGSLAFRRKEYNERWWWREFGRVSYLGGREYLQPSALTVDFQFPALLKSDTGELTYSHTSTVTRKSLLYQHTREKDWEYANRTARAYYHNIVRSTVNMLVSHAMKREPQRNVDDAVALFHKGVDESRMRGINSFVKQGARWAQVEGLMWACVDQKEVKDGGDGKPYAYWVNPLDILDWDVDEDGEINWLKQFVYAENDRSGENGWKLAPTAVHRYRIWSREGVVTYEDNALNGVEKEIDRRTYEIKRVPFEPLFSLRDEEYTFPDGQPLAIDLCKTANHVFNLSSLLSEILYKQTFSWLGIPDKNVNVIQMGLNTAFGYDPNQTSATPAYISPDADQARVLMEAIGSALEQARQAVGTGRGRSESSKQQASADALELESEDKHSILADIAEECEDFEQRLVGLFDAYRNKEPNEKTHIEYARQFDVRALQADIAEILSFKAIGVSPEVSLEMVTEAVRRRFAGMAPEKRDALLATLKVEDQKPPEPTDDEGNGPPGGPKKPGDDEKKPNPGRPPFAKAA